MQSDLIYKEKVFAKVIGGMLGAVAAIMLFILVYQILIEPFGDHPAPTLFFLIMFLLFLGLTINFGRLVIKITHHSITVGYGIIKKTIPWENIDDCYVDQTSTVKYGGAGIRVAKVKGKLVLVYNTIGTPRCVLSLKEGRFQEFVFSTKNPEEVINVVKGQLAISKH